MEKFIKKADGNILTPAFRVTFPHVFQPNEDGKYGLGMLFDDDVDFTVLERLIKETITEKWSKGRPSKLMLPILDGDDSDREEYQGKMYINGKCGKYAPGVVDQARAEITDPSEFYPGCWARAVVNCYSWTFKGKAGVSVGVRNLQKIKDGEPFLSRVKADDDFDDYEIKDTDDL